MGVVDPEEGGGSGSSVCPTVLGRLVRVESVVEVIICGQEHVDLFIFLMNVKLRIRLSHIECYCGMRRCLLASSTGTAKLYMSIALAASKPD